MNKEVKSKELKKPLSDVLKNIPVKVEPKKPVQEVPMGIGVRG